MLEKLLLNVDVGPGLAVVRVALGALLVAALHALAPRTGLGGAALALAATLFLLKIVAAVGRRLVPATPAVRARWEWRRALARQHDAFQWRKLLWVGAGILAAAAAAPRAGWELELAAACVFSGVLGELAWRRKGLKPLPPLAG